MLSNKQIDFLYFKSFKDFEKLGIKLLYKMSKINLNYTNMVFDFYELNNLENEYYNSLEESAKTSYSLASFREDTHYSLGNVIEFLYMLFTVGLFDTKDDNEIVKIHPYLLGLIKADEKFEEVPQVLDRFNQFLFKRVDSFNFAPNS